MKKQYIYSALVLTALLCAGCTKEIENTLESTDSAAIELSSVSTDPMTKAVITGTSFTTDEAAAGIGLFLLDGNGKAYGNNAGNVRYAHNDGKWTASQPLRIGNTEGTLVGYYPYSEGATNVKAIPVASSINGTDYLYGSIADITSAKAKSESLTLSHVLTRLRITFKRDASFVGSGTLSSLSIEGDGIAASGTLDATTGEISATNSAFTVSDLNATINTDGLTEDCLVVPAAASDTPQAVTLKFTVDGKAYKVDLADNLAVKLQSGIQTDITLTVKNTSVSIDGSSIGAWGDGGSQTVTVGGDYKVTISINSDVPAHDVLTDVYVDGSDVIIKANSSQGAKLICNVGDNAKCERTITNGKYIFTISEISSDIEAVLGYDPIVTLTVLSNSGGMVWIGNDMNEKSGQYEFGEQVVIHAKEYENFIFYGWKDNNKELNRTITVGVTDVTYSAIFIPKDAIPSLFTVDSNDKQVFFSKGNLYCSGVEFNDDGTVKSMGNAQWRFETNQYDTTPSRNDDRDNNHISHFMWCDDAANAMALNYNNEWNGDRKLFFAAKYFKVNGYGGWSVLTGGAGGEWEYLLDKRNTAYDSNRRYAAVMVNGMAGLLIFPDDFSSWPSGAGVEPQTFNTYSENWNGKDYSVAEFNALQNNGCVFLPAAGYRDGRSGNTRVRDAGGGYYWSASSLGFSDAFDLFFNSGFVDPSRSGLRSQACAVRLVTESN